MSAVVCRFAPSPTGALHAGNLRTALINKMLADQAGGAFILRFDDTDAERSEERFVDGIRADLAWLGLDWTREERQSGRMARYDAAAETLKAAGRLYPCYETPDELALKRKAALNAGRPPIYDRGALSLTPEERAAFLELRVGAQAKALRHIFFAERRIGGSNSRPDRSPGRI